MVAGQDDHGLLVEALKAQLGEGGVLDASEDLSRYERGWRYGEGRALCVARPVDAQQTGAVLALCREHGARVVAQGANTGLVGASTPDESGTMVVLATERMGSQIEIDARNRTAVVDAGVLLSTLQERLAPHGLFFPIDLGADPQIGGMIATNTGGTRLLRYGDVRANVLGLEAVLGDGTVLDQLRALRKDNTGFDQKQLFIGTGGAFGVITRAVLQLAPLPAQRTVALVGCETGEEVLDLLQELEHEAGELLSAFEVMSGRALTPVFAKNERLRNPFGAALPAYTVLVELATTLTAQRLDLDELLVCALSREGSERPTFFAEPDAFWAIRHSISEALRGEGRCLAFDIGLERSRLPYFTRAAVDLLSRSWPFARLCDYGHWGDGGTHLVVVWRDEEVEGDPGAVIAAIQDQIYELAVRDFGGSYSAEHGIGPHNQRFFDRFADARARDLVRTIARHCDPEGLLGRVRLW